MKREIIFSLILVIHFVASSRTPTITTSQDPLAYDDETTTISSEDGTDGIIVVLQPMDDSDDNSSSVENGTSAEFVSQSKSSKKTGNGDEGSAKSSEDDIFLIFLKNCSQNGNCSDTVPRSKRDEADRLSRPNQGDDDDTSDSKMGFTSTNNGSHFPKRFIDEIILLPPRPRPRPLIIDIILFRTNSSQNGSSSDSKTASPFGGQGVGHSNRINSDEDSNSSSDNTISPISRKKAPREASNESESTTTTNITWMAASNASGEFSTSRSHSEDSGNRRRRDTIFSHLTNNSQTDSSAEDGKHYSLKKLANPKDSNSFMSTTTAAQDEDESVDFKSSKTKKPDTRQESHNPGTDSNLFDVLEESLEMSFTIVDDANNNKTKRNASFSANNPIAKVAKDFFSIFTDIFGVGESTTNPNEEDILLLFNSSSSNSNDANSTNRTKESSGGDVHDYNDDDNGKTIATLSLSPSFKKSNQNATKNFTVVTDDDTDSHSLLSTTKESVKDLTPNNAIRNSSTRSSETTTITTNAPTSHLSLSNTNNPPDEDLELRP